MINVHIWAEPEGPMRLKDWSGATKAGVTTVTIRVEVPDPSYAGFFMKELMQAEAAQRATRKPIPKERRLPAPSDRTGE